MGRTHHFHLDDRGHSITVTVRPAAIQLMIDGTEVSLQPLNGTGTSVLFGELPDEPPRPFRILVRRSRLGSGIPRCTLVCGGVDQPMPQRTAPESTRTA